MPASAPPENAGELRHLSRILWAAYSLFVVYGTTIPFSFSAAEGGLASRLGRINWHPLGMNAGDISTPDLAQNLLLFLPFGFLGYLARVGPPAPAVRIAVAAALGAMLSAAVEALQLFSATRITAVSDLLCNAAGAALGAAAAAGMDAGLLRLRTHSLARRLLAAPSAFPALVLVLLAAAGSWVPFDFSLDVSEAAGDARALLRDPFALALPRDEAVTCLRFLLATAFACRLGDELGWSRTAVFLAMAAAAGCLEASQIILSSRTVSFQDAAAAWLGVAAGALAPRVAAERHAAPTAATSASAAWSGALIAAIGVSVMIAGLHPFRFQGHAGSFQWIPFLAEYERTGFDALANVLDGALAWFPLGFLLVRLRNPGTAGAAGSARTAGPALAALAVAAALSAGVEAVQPYVVGRYGDVTDVVGAALGSLAGSLVASRGWRAYREFAAAGAPVAVKTTS